jgi:hypothetical protein
MEETPREKRNRAFEAYKAKNPGRTYAEWLHGAAVNAVRGGSRHATLGGNIGFTDWWDAGRPSFMRYLKLAAFSPETKVVDYGCGSLRVGGHFIRYLERGNYFGLDVTTALIDTGKDLIGSEMVSEKTPQFGPIDAASLKRATAFGPDLVISTAVCYHVYPEEAPVYFGNLRRLTKKPGAKLMFDASVSASLSAEHALSMPVDYYVAVLAPLEFVKFHLSVERNGEALGVLEFRQPAKAKRRPAAPRKVKRS